MASFISNNLKSSINWKRKRNEFILHEAECDDDKSRDKEGEGSELEIPDSIDGGFGEHADGGFRRVFARTSYDYDICTTTSKKMTVTHKGGLSIGSVIEVCYQIEIDFDENVSINVYNIVSRKNKLKITEEGKDYEGFLNFTAGE